MLRIVIPRSIVSMEEIYGFFSHTLQQDIPKNLDALEEVLRDREVFVDFDDISHFRTIFDQKMSKKYFGSRYTQDMPTMSNLFEEIFQRN